MQKVDQDDVEHTVKVVAWGMRAARVEGEG